MNRCKLSTICAFQFPSNGKAYPKLELLRKPKIIYKSFQFPSNGKAYPKSESVVSVRDRRCGVSIPFKREGISKVSDITHDLFLHSQCFNSLQTGRHIQRRLPLHRPRRTPARVSIPFKREGISKAYHGTPKTSNYPFGFNSLQTGRHIQR